MTATEEIDIRASASGGSQAQGLCAGWFSRVKGQAGPLVADHRAPEQKPFLTGDADQKDSASQDPDREEGSTAVVVLA